MYLDCAKTTSRWPLLLAILGCGVGCNVGGNSRDASTIDSSAPPADAAGADAAHAADAAHGVDAPSLPDAASADAGDCPAVPIPPTPSSSPIPGESPAGGHVLTTVNGYQDDYLFDATDYLKIGTRREWGGSIIFFGIAEGYGAGVNDSNTIDANDTGREVQVAFYDPDRAMQDCAATASCASTPTNCPNSITYLGWNPVQGGNRCNNGSGVDSVDFSDGALSITTQPLFWNPNWDRTDCVDSACSDPSLAWRRSDVRVTQTLRFVATHVVQLDYQIENLSDLEHAVAGQEMPTVYTANGTSGPNLYRVMDSAGNEISVDTPGNDGFFYKNFTSPGGWVSLQRDTLLYGVGIYYENRLTGFQAWQLLSLPFNNVRAQFAFGIPAHGTVRARAYLMIGAYNDIASHAAWLDGALAPFGTLDSPVADATVSGSMAIAGWALDNRGVTAVDVLIDGAVAGSVAYGAPRADVCRVWPGYAGCNNVGFSGSIDLSGLSACPHLVEIRASDADGNQRVIAARRVYVAP